MSICTKRYPRRPLQSGLRNSWARPLQSAHPEYVPHSTDNVLTNFLFECMQEI